ncbi:MAG TPA: tail fiber domain-containing protein [Verrucomicrobiae bacterium]|jgi:hypothetical protein|nr:tail fiber domain-containing protein [Verrucomicrobiae bacterium]
MNSILLPRVLKAGAALAALGLAAFSVAAQSVPALLNYQGRLSNPDGSFLATADYAISIRIYDAPSGGALVWGPQVFDGQVALGHGPVIPVVQGYFNVMLGPQDISGNALAAAFSASNRFVELTISNHAPIAPRQQFLAAPYAFRAGAADSIGGQSAAAVAAATVAVGAATNASISGALVKRDASGSISAANLTVGGAVTLPSPPVLYGGTNLLLYGDGTSFYAGLGAGRTNSASSYNTGVGARALAGGGGGGQGGGNTALGYGSLGANSNGYQNTAVGIYALFNNGSGYDNTAVGSGSMNYNLSGADNTALGSDTLLYITNAYDNTAVGSYAMAYNGAGNENTGMGASVLENLTSGSENTADGVGALNYDTTGNDNTAVGAFTLELSSWGDENTALGANALLNNTVGSFNTACGAMALSQNIGSNNIALGYGAGQGLSEAGNSNNIDIGNPGFFLDAGVMRIGTSGVQKSAYLAGISGVTVSGGAPVYVNSVGQLGVLTSSAKYKEDIHPMSDSSDVLFDLRPVAFRYRPDLDPGGLRQFGLIAEEVDRVDPELVLHDEQSRAYTVRYEAINAMLLNEFLKEHRKVKEQGNEISELKGRLEALEKTVQGGKSK